MTSDISKTLAASAVTILLAIGCLTTSQSAHAADLEKCVGIAAK